MSKPSFLANQTKKVCLICEGFEEYEYILQLLSLQIWSDVYDFYPINAECCGNIAPIYHMEYSKDKYDIIIAICDTDKTPSKGFFQIREKIDDIFGIKDASDQVIIFTNPCTMQVILMHFGTVKLTTQSKKTNTSEIRRLTGLATTADYKARKDQRTFIFSQITKANYLIMKNNISSLSHNFLDNPSTNFLKFLNLFEASNISWIESINQIIDPDDK